MKDSSDIRLKILDHLNKSGRSTEEINCNNFLVTLHNDLGTIKRTLIELIEKGYIKESNVDWDRERETSSVIFKIKTIGNLTRKDSKRLLNPEDIKAIRLYLTLEGKKFLIESENLKHYSWTIRNDWWLKIVYLIIGSILTFTVYLIRDFQTKTEKNTVESNSQNTVGNKMNIKIKTDTIEQSKSEDEKQKNYR